MKIFSDLIRQCFTEIIHLLQEGKIKSGYIITFSIWFFIYFGIWALATLIYLFDWCIHDGTRSELLLLIDRL